ncbi:MAG: [acyl-carrier-protein] S-malonyltransferase [Deltaproteobacteria bacterium HGW-Deltaproteobacteria-4]|nr:MAG: [acyl-carrier-protein] S-malonyltransferase [Deltaproteobacteria bacterium HGW-Deltaproteobacteria-4]
MNAFIFPGQGAQFPGMGKDLFESFSVSRQVFEEANEVLEFDLAGLCFNGPEDDLKLTRNTQPAILTMSIAALRVVETETGLRPSFAAGHSLGEYSALVCSGAIDFAAAVKTVRLRGTFMQEAVPVGVGAMAAILSAEADALVEICAEAAQGEVVAPANYNSPGQIVIAGHASAVQRAMEIAKGKGYRKAMLLPVSAPFHCALMQPAADRLKAVLDGLTYQKMQLPVVTNVEAHANVDCTRVQDLLVAQVCAPVLWEQSVNAMIRSGVTRFIEIGPGKVLSGLVKRISKDVQLANVEDRSSLALL